jgi:hypothetical protein
VPARRVMAGGASMGKTFMGLTDELRALRLD